MRIAYLDCFSGISGDMFLGALVDAGVSPELLRRTVHALGIGAELEIHRVTRNGIAATKVDVVVGGVKDMPREEFQALKAAHSHGHHHEHEHHHHGHEHHHHDEHAHSHSHRGLNEIREIIARADIAPKAKERALAIFQVLGEAEAKIHNTDVEKIHFHEVGSEDAIVDIVCAAVGSEALGVDEWRCSPLNVGGGTVKCAHGVMPVPAPATVELLKNAPVYSSDIQKELVTPTGAAIVRTLVKEYGSFPAMKVGSTGYGAGTRDFANAANVLRLTVGESIETISSGDSVTVIEANLDDLSPQVFGFVLERLLGEGALDAFGVPVQMKKSRPGILLTVLAKPGDAERLSSIIFSETTTIGLRMRDEIRATLERRWETVETRWGPVRIKVAEQNGTERNAAPEFEDCRKLAVENSVALKTVMQEAMQQYFTKTKSRAISADPKH